MRLIGLRTAAIQFNKSERTLRRWIREGMRHRRDSRRRIWLEHWVVISWVQYKTLVDRSKELPRAAAGYEITSVERERIIQAWIRAGGQLPTQSESETTFAAASGLLSEDLGG